MHRKTIENEQQRKSTDVSKSESKKKAKVENQRDTKDNFQTNKYSEKSDIINIENKNKPGRSDNNSENEELLNSPTTPTNELKLAPDLVDTDYLLPFRHGWTRTVVYRSGTNKTRSDVYYYSNTGNKYRSLRDLPENFENAELTKKNFTFSRRQILENDSEYEIVRESEPKQKKTNKNAKLKSSPRHQKVEKAEKNINRSIQSPSDSLLDTSSNTSERRRSLICSKRCRKYRGISPTLKCVHCNHAYHPGCLIGQPALFTPHFVCINCKSSIPNNAETEFLNSNPASLHFNDENEFIAGSLENSSQSVEILDNKNVVIIPRSTLPRMSFLSNPNDLTQVKVGRILPDNSEQISLELFRKADVFEFNFENVDQD